MPEPENYYATYCRLEEASGDSCVVLNANAVIIAAELTVTKQVHVTKRGKEVPRILLSRGKEAMGFLPDKVFKQVDGLLDDGWTCRAFASAVVIDKIRNTNWVEVAIVCYPSKDAPVFEPFVASIADRIAKGDHPAIALSSKELVGRRQVAAAPQAREGRRVLQDQAHDDGESRLCRGCG